MAGLAARWWTDPDYLHGFLVPFFAAYLLWYRRELLRGFELRGAGGGWPS